MENFKLAGIAYRNKDDNVRANENFNLATQLVQKSTSANRHRA
jgi:hypothetical protein